MAPTAKGRKPRPLPRGNYSDSIKKEVLRLHRAHISLEMQKMYAMFSDFEAAGVPEDLIENLLKTHKEEITRKGVAQFKDLAIAVNGSGRQLGGDDKIV